MEREAALPDALLALSSILPPLKEPLVLEPSPPKDPRALSELCILGMTVGTPADLEAWLKAARAESFIESLKSPPLGGKLVCAAAIGCDEGAPRISEAGSLALKGVMTSPEPSGEPWLKELMPGS